MTNVNSFYDTNIYAACKNENMELIDLIITHDDSEFLKRYVFKYACEKNKLNMIKWLATKIDISKLTNIVYQCCLLGRIEILTWLFNNYSIYIDNNLFSEIIELQEINIVKLIIKNNPLIDINGLHKNKFYYESETIWEEMTAYDCLMDFKILNN